MQYRFFLLKLIVYTYSPRENHKKKCKCRYKIIIMGSFFFFKLDSQEDYGYGGPWPDYDMNYGPPHKTRHEAPRDNEEDMLSSMGLPTSFTASIDQSMENFAEDIPLEAKGRNTQGGKCST